jgi:hypothetical protein
MQHSVEELIRRINAMHDLALQAHRVRNEFSEISNKKYDKHKCNHLLEQVQALALGIASDTTGEEIKTEMEYKHE